MMKKILLLDMYGVIIEESKGNFIPYVYGHMPESRHPELTRLLREECLFTRAGLGEIRSGDFLSRLGFTDPDAAMKDYLCHYLTLDQGFIPFAETVSGDFECVLLSNDVWEWSEFLMEKHGLTPYFSHTFVSGKLHLRKPDREIFSCCLNALGVPAGDCVFVDNRIDNLNQAARMGITPIHFDRDGEEYDGLSVKNFAELAKLVRTM